MKREDINFGFLWEEKQGAIFDANHPFDEKWDGEYMKYSDYVKSATIEDVISLIVYTYKDNFPRDYWTAVMAKGMISKYIQKVDDYDCVEGEHFVHSEISLYKERSKEDELGFSYVIERIFEFNENLNLVDSIEKVIFDNEYSRDKSGKTTTFKVENSPIDEIVVSNREFHLKINESFYARRSY